MTYFFRGEFRDDLVVALRLRGRHCRTFARGRGLNGALSLQSTDLTDLETLRTLNLSWRVGTRDSCPVIPLAAWIGLVGRRGPLSARMSGPLNLT